MLNLDISVCASTSVMLWVLLGELALLNVLTGASYQVFLCSVVDSEAPYKASSTRRLPYSLNCPSTSSSRGSCCRKAAVVWARSRVERLGKIACGHRNNNCRARASLWRTIISFKETLGSESARRWRGFSLVSKAVILKHLLQWNIAERALAWYTAALARQQREGWPSTANKTVFSQISNNLSAVRKREQKELLAWNS